MVEGLGYWFLHHVKLPNYGNWPIPDKAGCCPQAALLGHPIIDTRIATVSSTISCSDFVSKATAMSDIQSTDPQCHSNHEYDDRS